MPLSGWVVAAFSFLAFAEAVLFVSRARGIRTQSLLSPPDPDRWPRVSVIVPARDEADGIGAALRSRIADDYPDLEIIVVDDRSSDGTGDIARAVAAGDPRVRVLRIDQLRDGWLGKVNALETGLLSASGDWLLFSDADVHVMPGALRRSIACAEHERLDMVALIPEYTTRDPLVAVVWTVFLRTMGLVLSPKAIRDARSKQALGSGAYNLVRRTALEASPGFEWLRLETADDLGLAMLVKGAGGSLEVMNGRGAAQVEIYPSMQDFVRGLEKNGGTTAGRPWRFTLGMIVYLLIDWSPFAAVASGLSSSSAPLTVMGILAIAAMTFVHVAALRFNTGRILPALLWPVGSALFAFGTLRSTWLVRQRGGVIWRGTFHALADIDSARKFEF